MSLSWSVQRDLIILAVSLFMVAAAANVIVRPAFCLSLRFVYRRYLVNLENLFFFGVYWFALVMAGYQVFTTPLVHLVLGLLEHELSFSFILGAWSAQLWIEESIAVAVISTLGMVIARMYFLLRYREQHLRTILHSIGDGVIVTNCEEEVELMNPVAENLTGWRGVEARGKSLSEVFNIVHAESGKPCGSPVQRVIEEGVTVGLANHTRLVSRDGTIRQIADRGAPVNDAEGFVRGAVLVFRDVTEEYTLREELGKELQEKNILLQEVHHRVKNNLQIISSLLHLQSDMAGDDLIRAVLEDLRMRIVSMSLIHNQLYRTGLYSEIDMEQYVTTLAEELLNAYGRAGTISVTMAIRGPKLGLQTFIMPGGFNTPHLDA